MSRIGKQPIPVPAGVEVNIDGSTVTVKGSSVTLSNTFHTAMKIDRDESGALIVTRPSDSKEHRSLHGLTRALLANMVTGVSQGFRRELEINGVGYRAQKQGKSLIMNLGYSHQITMEEIDGITVEVPSPNKVIVSGADKQVVGQFAAEIRKQRPPEPYKGKGIKYSDEIIRRKEGKAGKGKA